MDQKTILLAPLFALLALASYEPINLAPGGLVCFIPLFVLSKTASKKRRFLLGWLAGLTFQALGYFWVFHAIRDFGGMNGFISSLGCFLFFLYQGLDVGLWLLFMPILAKRLGGPLIAGPMLWLCIGHLFPYVFPWSLGSSQAQMAGVGYLAKWIGSEGIAAYCVFLSGLLIHIHQTRQLGKWSILAIAIPIVGLLPLPLQEKEMINVAIVQPNFVPLAKSKDPHSSAFLTAHVDGSESILQQNPDFIVWPETALPFLMKKDGPTIEYLRGKVQNWQASLFFGVIGKTDEGYTNSIWLIDQSGKLSAYDKQKLVMFSESLPWPFRWALYFDPNIGGFRPGPQKKELHAEGLEIVPLVCFEAILPNYVGRFRGDLIVNVTNDVWFGKSRGSALHLQQLKLRAVEMGSPLIRSTNSGISCVVNRFGKIENPTPIYKSISRVYPVTPSSYRFFPGIWMNKVSVLFSLFYCLGAALLLFAKIGSKNE